MKDEKTLYIDSLENEEVINEVEETEEEMVVIDEDEEGTLDIVPDVPQEFIDKYHKDVQTKHRTDTSVDNK